MGFSTHLELSWRIRSFLQNLCKFSEKKESRPSRSRSCVGKLRGIPSLLNFRGGRTSENKVRTVKMQKKYRDAVKGKILSPKQTVLSRPGGVQRKNFKTITTQTLEEVFTNHESIPSLDASYESFTNIYPDFVDTLVVDDVRAEEYGNLEENAHVCLDYSGYGLFSHLQQELDTTSCSFGLAYTTANLPVHALYGGADEGTVEFDIKKRIMRFLNIQESEYSMVFTASRGSAFRLLAESYPFHTNKRLLTVYDHESQGVSWMEEVARKKGANIMSAQFRWPTLRLCSSDLKKQIIEKKKKKETAKGLFVFPLQSRVSGAKYSYQWMSQAQENGWHVLFDASALAPKVMDSLGLSVFQPDFIISSFYKVYGSDPTGFGCLLIKNSTIQCLHNSSAARGVGMVKIIPVQISSPNMLHTTAVLEEQEIHEIEEKDGQNGTGLFRMKAGQRELICVPSFSGPVTLYGRVDKRTVHVACLPSLEKETSFEPEVGASHYRAKVLAAGSGAVVESRNPSPSISHQENEASNEYTGECERYLPSAPPVNLDFSQSGNHVDVAGSEKSDIIGMTADGKVWKSLESSHSKRPEGLELNKELSLANDDVENEREGTRRNSDTGEFGSIPVSSSFQEHKFGRDSESGASGEGGGVHSDQAYPDTHSSHLGTKGKLASDDGIPEALSLSSDNKLLLVATPSNTKTTKESSALFETLGKQQAGQGLSVLADDRKEQKNQVKDLSVCHAKASKDTANVPSFFELEGETSGRVDVLLRCSVIGEMDHVCREDSSSKQVGEEIFTSCKREKSDTESLCGGQRDNTLQQETERSDISEYAGVEILDSSGLQHDQESVVDDHRLSFTDVDYSSQQWSSSESKKVSHFVHSGEGASCAYYLDGQRGPFINSEEDATTFSHQDEESNENDVLDEISRGRKEPEMICRGLNHADSLGLSKMNNRHRYLVNWLVASMLRLRHPGPDNAIPLTQIYGPKVKYDRGASLAFNLFDWNGDLLQPILVQRLADRSNISLGIGSIHHVEFPESHTDLQGLLEYKKSSNIGTPTNEGQDEVGGKSTTIKVVAASLGFLTNFQDVYRLWAFVAKFLDADFLSKEVWRYRSLNQETIVVGM